MMFFKSFYRTIFRNKRGWQYGLWEWTHYWFFGADNPKWRWLDRKVFRFCNWPGWCKLYSRHRCVYMPGCRGLRKQELVRMKAMSDKMIAQQKKYGGTIVRHDVGWVDETDLKLYSCCPGEHTFETSCLLRIKPPIRKRP